MRVPRTTSRKLLARERPTRKGKRAGTNLPTCCAIYILIALQLRKTSWRGTMEQKEKRKKEKKKGGGGGGEANNNMTIVYYRIPWGKQAIKNNLDSVFNMHPSSRK